MPLIAKIPTPSKVRARITELIRKYRNEPEMVQLTEKIYAQKDLRYFSSSFAFLLERTELKVEFAFEKNTPLSEWLNSFRKDFQSGLVEFYSYITKDSNEMEKLVEDTLKYAKWNYFFLEKDMSLEKLHRMVSEWLEGKLTEEANKYLEMLQEDPIYYWNDLFWKQVLFVYSISQFPLPSDLKDMASDLVNIYIEFHKQYSERDESELSGEQQFMDAHSTVLNDTSEFIKNVKAYLENQKIGIYEELPIPYQLDDALLASGVRDDDVDTIIECMKENDYDGVRQLFLTKTEVKVAVRGEETETTIVDSPYYRDLPGLTKNLLCLTQEERLSKELRSMCLGLAEVLIDIQSKPDIFLGKLTFELGVLYDLPLSEQKSEELAALKEEEKYNEFNKESYLLACDLIVDKLEAKGAKLRDIHTFTVGKAFSDKRQLGYILHFNYKGAKIIVSNNVWAEGLYQKVWHFRLNFISIDGDGRAEILAARDLVSDYLLTSGAIDRCLKNMNYTDPNSNAYKHMRRKLCVPREPIYLTNGEIESLKKQLDIGSEMIAKELSKMNLKRWEISDKVKEMSKEFGITENAAWTLASIMYDFCPTNKRIAQMIGISEDKVIESAKELLSKGLLIEKTKHGRNYFLPVPILDNIGLGSEEYRNEAWSFATGPTKLWNDGIPTSGSPAYYLAEHPRNILEIARKLLIENKGKGKQTIVINS
ncbi:MAG: hypothetical protein QXT63_05350 [Thermoplasmata archaeon]